MPRRRGEARISAPRRRTYRIKVKWDPHVIGRRFKVYVPGQVPELEWEIQILEELEQRVYTELTAKGVSSDLWLYYRDFAYRLWERRVKFTGETYLEEKTSLHNEFTLRGLNPTILSQIQPISEEMAQKKVTILDVCIYSM